MTLTGSLRVTCHHEARGSVRGLLVVLARGQEILENVDVWRKVDHVLLSAAVRHLDQRVQAADGRTQDVACWRQRRRKE